MTTLILCYCCFTYGLQLSNLANVIFDNENDYYNDLEWFKKEKYLPFYICIIIFLLAPISTPILALIGCVYTYKKGL